MRLKHIVLGAAARELGRRVPAWFRRQPRIRSYRCSLIAPARSPIPASRSPTACMTTSTMLNARDGGIGGSKIVFEECETGYKNEKGVECYESLKSKKPAVITPYSTGITLALDPESGGRPHPGPVDGLRPVRVGGRQRLPVDLQSAGHLLGWPVHHHPLHRRQGRRPRQAQGQDHRLHLLRRRLRPRADPAARPAWPRTTASP